MSGRLRASCLPALALPVLVWYLGSFYFHGELGKWLDDFGAHVRDPASGSFEWSKLLRYQWWFFWRPIHVHLVFFLQTVFYNHDGVNHLFSALMHALACFGLWKFLRECGLRPAACAIAALLMLGAPQGFEAIHWPATVSTSIAAAAFFWASRIAIRHAQRRHRAQAVLVLGLLGFLIPCLYEQPSAALAALPIVYLGAAISRRSTSTIPAVLRRMVVALTPCALGLILYLVLYLVTVRSDPMTRESNIGVQGFNWPRIEYMVWVLGRFLDPIHGMGELWRAGRAAIKGSALGLAGWSIVAAIASAAWVVSCQRLTGRACIKDFDAASPPPNRPADQTHSPGWPVPRPVIILFAIASVVLSMLPILAVSGAGLTPRLTYFPLACALIVVGVLADAIIGWFGTRQRLGAGILAAVAAAGALAGSVLLIGVQSYMRQRYETDMDEMRQIAAMVPQPPGGSIFVALGAAPDPRDPRADRLHVSFLPIWDSPWGANTLVKHVFHRSDVNVSAIYTFNQANGIVRLGEPTMIAWNHYNWHLPTPRVENYCPRFGLDQMIPFRIDAKGQVSLVDRIDSRQPDGTPVGFVFPAARAAGMRGAPVAPMALGVPIERGNPWVLGWTWGQRHGGEVRYVQVQSWGASERAVRMHPPTPGLMIDDPNTDEMELRLTKTGVPRRFVFYATFDQQTIDLSVQGDGVDLVWTLEGGGIEGGSRLIRREHLDPKETKARGAWTAITLDLPPLESPCTLRLAVTPGPNGNVNYDRVLVSRGEEIVPPPKETEPKKE